MDRRGETYVAIHQGSRIFGIEEMPVATDGPPKFLRRHFVHGVDGEGFTAGWPVADVHPTEGGEACGVVVCESGEEEGAPV